uniref:DEAD/DEAH box helicase n=1 Tax=Haemonchus placei TaxID=6290 RepID=A0A0N4X7C6_HAEPC
LPISTNQQPFQVSADALESDDEVDAMFPSFDVHHEHDGTRLLFRDYWCASDLKELLLAEIRHGKHTQKIY